MTISGPTNGVLGTIPGWIPICITILGCSFGLGMKMQNFEDRLAAVETVTKQLQTTDQQFHDYILTYQQNLHIPPKN